MIAPDAPLPPARRRPTASRAATWLGDVLVVVMLLTILAVVLAAGYAAVRSLLT